MQNKINRVLSLLLVVIMVLSMIPAALAAETSDSVAYAAENTTTGAQYADLNEAIATAQAGQIVRVLADAENVVYNNAGVIVDLNGCDLTNVTVAEGVTLTAIDSATDDYEGNYGSVTTDGNVAATVKTAEPKSYVAISENGSYSFHRYYASIAAISLQPSKVSLGYRAEFRGDEAVKNAVVSYGYELWANDNAHKTYSRTDALEKTSMTLRLSNILREGNDALNAMGSTATIGGNAFITLDLGNEQVTLYGTQQETTLRQVVEAVNATASQYGEAQLASVREMITTYSAWMMGWATENIFGSGNDTEGDGLKVEIVVDVNAENNILSENATMTYGDISATVPQGAVLENGVKQLVLTITEKAQSDSDVTEGEGETLIPLDVHISGISADNTAPIVICLGDILPKGLNIGNYDLFHVENGQTVSMTRVYTVAELDAHNEFYYDPATGSVTVAMASFSEITLRSNDENAWNGEIDTSWADKAVLEIANADQLAGFGKLVDDGNTFEGKTITLIHDIDLMGYEKDAEGNYMYEDGEKVRISFNPIGYGYLFNSATTGRVFMGTFDGNGNTISNLYQNGWDLNYTYGAMGGGLFASVANATIKNLTMDNAYIVMECVDMGTVVGYAQGNCVFENIIVKNSTLANYQRYTGGAIGEVSNGHHILKNVDVEASTTVGTLWGDFDASVGGIIGGKWAHSYDEVYGKDGKQRVTVYMENCDVAAKLDVYNDVTSAYQWYSYRRAGMLIGYSGESTSVNGRTEATAPYLTTVNCTVQYGDWVNYRYCEFNNTTSLNACYPWVRVQAGEFNGAYSNPRYGVPTFANNTLNTETHTLGDGCHVDGDGHDVLIVFNQLYGGGQGCYGGNTHVEQELGVTVIGQNGNAVVPTTKFQATGIDTIVTDTTVTLGDLFQAVDGVAIQDAYVYGFASPDDANASVRGTTATPYAGCNWQDLTIQFTGTGLAKVTISDYYYCQPTTIYVNVVAKAAQIGECEYATVQDALNNAKDGDTIELLADVLATEYVDIFTANNGEEERSITLNLNGNTIVPTADYTYKYYPLVFVGINQTLTIQNGSIIADEHVAIGAYGKVILDNVNVSVKNPSEGEQAVCIWNWGEDDEYYQDCQYKITGSAEITGGNITGGILAEGAVKLNETAGFDKLYLNTKTGHGKIDLPTGYGLVKENGYYTNLHEHEFENGACTTCGFSTSYVETDLANIKSTDVVVITMTKDGTTYALTSANGTSGTPDAIEVTVKDGTIISDIPEALEWNIINENDTLTIYTNADNTKYLYCINDTTGIRVGQYGNSDQNNTFNISSEGYLYNIGQKRYIGVYNGKDWRSYTTLHDNIKGETLAFYVLKTSCDHTNKEDRSEIAATCIEAGHAAGSYCLDCDSYISGGELIDAMGHSWGDPTTKPASCTENGKNIYHCTVCNKVKTETIKAAHTWDNGTVTVEATCTEAGEKTTTCTVCGKTETEIIEAIGHTEITATIDATCANAGSTIVSCSVCKAVISNTEIPATGNHVYNNGTCTGCGKTEESLAGTYYIAAKRSSGNYWYMTCDLGTASTKRYQAEDTGLTTLPAEITNADADKVFVIEKVDGGYIIYAQGVATNNYLGWSSGNSGALVAKTSAKVVTITPSANGAYQIKFDDRNLSLNNTASNNYFAFYTGTQVNDLYLIPVNGEISSCQHINTTTTSTATCTEDGVATVTCNDCGKTISTTNVAALGHTTENGTCGNCGQTIGGTTPAEPKVVLEITVGDFNTTSYVANNNTKTENGYSYTSYQVMNQSSVMQWQKSKGYITIDSNVFTKLELKVTAGTFTVTVGGKTVTGTTTNGVTTYDLTGLTGQIKISVGSATGKVDYLKFYK
ncbi:MAG: hypothetical protein IKW10_03110 [Oscillospiraceae bacterium]|nr:hypothetical protein [Oscillospiraceae bacterium]